MMKTIEIIFFLKMKLFLYKVWNLWKERKINQKEEDDISKSETKKTEIESMMQQLAASLTLD